MNEKPDLTDLRERFIWVVHHWAGDGTGKGSRWLYQYLGERYGIDARKWKNVCNRVQQPSLEMIAAICSDRPEFLSWLVMGHAVTTIQIDPTEDGWREKLTLHRQEGLDSLLMEIAKGRLKKDV